MDREPNLQNGLAIGNAVTSLLSDMEATTTGGFHPTEVCLALAAVVGAYLGKSDLSRDPAYVERVIRSMGTGVREAMMAGRGKR